MPEGPAGAPRLYNYGPFSRLTEDEIRENWEPCPDSGKEADICVEIKKAALAILEGQQVFAQCDTLEKINSGRCDSVADRVHRELPYTLVLRIGDADHFWIEYKGKHYDAEAPTGVYDYTDLPIFSRFEDDFFVRNAKRWRANEIEQRNNLEDGISTIDDTLVDVTEER